MSRGKRGQALLIAVISFLLLSLLATHMMTIAALQYDLAQVRRYTSNTRFHAQSVIDQVSEAIEKGLKNYEVSLLEQMKPMIYQYMVSDDGEIEEYVTYDSLKKLYQVDLSGLESVIKAYSYLWVLEQYFNDGGKPSNIQLSKQKQLYYEIRTERPKSEMLTQIKVKLYAGGMGGDINGTGKLTKEKVNRLANHTKVRQLLVNVESALISKEKENFKKALKLLEEELEKGYFMIETIAQTKDGTKIYDTRQVLGYVNLKSQETLDIHIQEQYKWQGEAKGILSYSLVCYGGIEDSNNLLKVEGMTKSHEEPSYLEEELSYEKLKRLGIEKLEDDSIDISQYNKFPMILVIDRDQPTLLYASLERKNTFEGIIIAKSPLILKTGTNYRGSILCDEGLRIEGEIGEVYIESDQNIFFELSIEQRLLWEAFGLLEIREDGEILQKGITLDDQMNIYLSTNLISTTIVHIEDGRMVDLGGV